MSNCQTEWRQCIESSSKQIIFIDLIIDGTIHRLNEYDLLTLEDISKQGYNLLLLTPTVIKENKRARAL